ncbi:MAG: hypothetical protein AseanaTS_11430 [Candidatus Pelagadaptatus aseana]|uniref:hypothetical protein n=1 Tax=Candidatus Pelagadaptatus aseana TaxID=3120508 RepID=UPI0039B13AEB
MNALGMIAKVTTLLLCLSVSQWSWGVGEVEENPSALAMTTDALIVRPVMIATTIVGSALWLVSAPFSLMGGNADQAADTLIVGPAESAFKRCLGCIGDGYKRGNMTE